MVEQGVLGQNKLRLGMEPWVMGMQLLGVVLPGAMLELAVEDLDLHPRVILLVELLLGMAIRVMDMVGLGIKVMVMVGVMARTEVNLVIVQPEDDLVVPQIAMLGVVQVGENYRATMLTWVMAMGMLMETLVMEMLHGDLMEDK